jgi:hypothetical protein
MKRFFNSPTFFLYFWIIFTIAVWSRQFLDERWHPSPKASFGRLIQHPGIAAIELCFVVVLLLLTLVIRTRPNWVIVGVGFAAAFCALYHMFVYSIGVDMLLLVATTPVIREYMKSA